MLAVAPARVTLREMTGDCRLAQWRSCALLLLVLESGCATPLTPQGARVFVVRTPLNQSPPQQPMPAACALVAATPTLSRTEFELEGQHDPFREDRNRAGAAGANVLLVRSRVTVPRHDFDCPAASPITDCPASSGAWYDVVIESYTCPDDVAQALGARKTPP
jgi:hypothetical protein